MPLRSVICCSTNAENAGFEMTARDAASGARDAAPGAASRSRHQLAAAAVAAAAAATAGLSERVGAARGFAWQRRCGNEGTVSHKLFPSWLGALRKSENVNIGASWALGSAK